MIPTPVRITRVGLVDLWFALDDGCEYRFKRLIQDPG